MNDDILSLFEGLTPRQAKELRAKIIPTLQELRLKVVQQTENQKPLDLGTCQKGNINHERKKTP